MTTMDLPGFQWQQLGERHGLWIGELPNELRLDARAFDELWNLHPDEYLRIKIHGRTIPTPRWQQAYGQDYRYTGQVNRALPMLRPLEPLLAWARGTIDGRLNGVLVNWYDGRQGHYIGAHRDSVVDMCVDTPIVTLSLGEDRVFRLRPWRGAGRVDVSVRDGTVLVMPQETNLAWTHEVPASRRRIGRRVSVTCRGFVSDERPSLTASPAGS